MGAPSGVGYKQGPDTLLWKDLYAPSLLAQAKNGICLLSAPAFDSPETEPGERSPNREYPFTGSALDETGPVAIRGCLHSVLRRG